MRVDEAARAVAAWRARGERIVVASGSFDLVGTAQARALAALRSGADRLLVALWDDRTAGERLGRGRPVQDGEERARIVAALRGVDAVAIADPAGCATLIAAAGPGTPSLEIGDGAAAERIARVRDRAGRTE